MGGKYLKTAQYSDFQAIPVPREKPQTILNHAVVKQTH